MDMPLVTACLIVRDEAHNLAACLASLAGFADEVVVVDTGSADGTPALAAELGARVVHEPWEHDFARHRNTSLAHATGRWCLVVDADERVDDGAQQTRALLAQDAELPDVLLAHMTLQYPEETLEIAVPRLLRRAAGLTYVYPVHERLRMRSAEVALSPLSLSHSGYAAPDVVQEKHRRNLALAQRGDQSDPHIQHCVARAAFALQEWSVALSACRALALAQDAAGPAAAESAVLGALAALSLAEQESLVALVEAGNRMRPDHPDQLLLSTVVAALRYHAALSGGPVEEPSTFEHVSEAAEHILAAFPLAELTERLSERLMQPLFGVSA